MSFIVCFVLLIIIITITCISFFQGFECRCGSLFCSLHRYADKHECSFDYKKMGREEIQKRNPKVVAAKIEKI